MPPTDMLGALSALSASVSWGGGDFLGGYASRIHHPFQVLAISATIGLLPLLPLTLLAHESWPSGRTVLLAAAAGAAGTLGLAAFYRGLKVGRTSVVAPLASLLGVLVPLVVGSIEAGLPTAQRAVGFACGLVGVWLVTAGPQPAQISGRAELRDAILAGIGFGGFLTLIAQVEGGQLYSPLIVSKLAGLVLTLVIVQRLRLRLVSPAASGTAALAGLLDTAGNTFFLFGTQLTRLDVVAVLSSLYPAVTVLLGRWVLREAVSPRGWAGVIVCVLAIILITA